jgi:hypothetical protein
MSDYHNEASQKQRADVLKNDRNNTLQFRTSADLGLENTGRFAKPFAVTGTEPSAQYPRLPPSSPWHDVVVPDEPPLGFSVEDHEPCGEYGEVQASIEALGDATSVGPQSVASPLAAVAAPSEVLASPADVERTAAISNSKRRSLR